MITNPGNPKVLVASPWGCRAHGEKMNVMDHAGVCSIAQRVTFRTIVNKCDTNNVGVQECNGNTISRRIGWMRSRSVGVLALTAGKCKPSPVEIS